MTNATLSYRPWVARRCWVSVLILAMLPAFACNRYRANRELQRSDCFAQIVERVDRRWIGNDRFFEDNLLANPYPEVRQWCAIALGRIASPRGLPLLYRAIQTGDASVRAAAAFALGEILDRDFPQAPPCRWTRKPFRYCAPCSTILHVLCKSERLKHWAKSGDMRRSRKLFAGWSTSSMMALDPPLRGLILDLP